jgi:hypothetical protein
MIKKEIWAFAAGSISAALGYALLDWIMLGKSKNLAQCEFESGRATTSMPHSDAEPISTLRNQTYYSTQEALIVACMKSNGYRQREPETSTFVVQLARTLRDKDLETNPNNALAAAKIETLWERRWPWN